jgi:SRSO17 transposase
LGGGRHGLRHSAGLERMARRAGMLLRAGGAGDPRCLPRRVPAAGADALAKHLSEEAWFRASAGRGSKGGRLYDWACVALPDLDSTEEAGRWLLLRRSIEDPPEEYAYYLTYAPAETPVHELIQIAGRRWQVEDSFEAAKGEVGLDEYEVYASGRAGTGI